MDVGGARGRLEGAAMKKPDRVFRVFYRHRFADPAFMSLPPAQPSGRHLYVHLTIGEQTSAIPGLLRAGRAEVAESLSWSDREFGRCFGELEDRGLAHADWARRVILLPLELTGARCQSPNVATAWARVLVEFPACLLVAQAVTGLRQVLTTTGEVFLKAFDEALPEALPKAFQEGTDSIDLESPRDPFPNQKQKQKQEQEHETKDIAPTRTLMALFDQLHTERFQAKADLQGAKGAKLLADLWRARRDDPVTVEMLIRAFFASNDPYIVSRGFTPGVLVGQVGKLISQARGRWASLPAAASTDVDWYQECGRLHNHACGSRLIHHNQKDIEAAREARKAASA